MIIFQNISVGVSLHKPFLFLVIFISLSITQNIKSEIYLECFMNVPENTEYIEKDLIKINSWEQHIDTYKQDTYLAKTTVYRTSITSRTKRFRITPPLEMITEKGQIDLMIRRTTTEEILQRPINYKLLHHFMSINNVSLLASYHGLSSSVYGQCILSDRKRHNKIISQYQKREKLQDEFGEDLKQIN